VAPAPLSRLLDPAALQPTALLEPVQERVERGDVEAHQAVRAGGDELADLVAVARPRLDEGQDEQLRAALDELLVCPRLLRDILRATMSAVNYRLERMAASRIASAAMRKPLKRTRLSAGISLVGLSSCMPLGWRRAPGPRRVGRTTTRTIYRSRPERRAGWRRGRAGTAA